VALQDYRIALLTRTPRPKIWDFVAHVLVIGATVFLVYAANRGRCPCSHAALWLAVCNSLVGVENELTNRTQGIFVIAQSPHLP
jgi:hypothetical protein